MDNEMTLRRKEEILICKNRNLLQLRNYSCDRVLLCKNGNLHVECWTFPCVATFRESMYRILVYFLLLVSVIN